MTPGLVVVWSDGAPMLRAILLPQTGTLSLGSSMFEDDAIAPQHAEVGRWLHGGILITDLGSEGGTHVDGVQLQRDRSLQPPALIRIGNTLLVAVPDITPYLGRTPIKRYGLDVCVSLHEPCEQLAQAILDETNVAIAGPRWVTQMLGHAYLEARGGGPEVDIAARTRTLEAALATGGAKTVLLESPNALLPPEYRTVRNWLETDVRFVTCMRRARDLDAVPHAIRRWLAPVVIEIPALRHDELPFVIHATARHYAPKVEVQVTLVESFLLGVREHGEDEMFHRLAERLRFAVGAGASAIATLEIGGRSRRDTFRVASYPVEEDD